MKAKVLITESNTQIKDTLKSRFEQSGNPVLTVPRLSDAVVTLTQADDIGVWVFDLQAGGPEWGQIKRVRDAKPRLKIVLVGSDVNKGLVFQAFKTKVSDFFEKPLDTKAMFEGVERALREFESERYRKELIVSLEDRVHRLEGAENERFWFVSKAKAMEGVNELLTSLRRESMRGPQVTEPAVLLLGEVGSGLEGVARMIRAGSKRGKQPWVALDCRNTAEKNLEQSLFGLETGNRGVFEMAKGGTVFLENIEVLDSTLQAKLLRVLQEGAFRRVGGEVDLEADIRLIVSSDQSLKVRVREKKFREDLYHRLNSVTFEIPSLRERQEDIVPMATQFAQGLFRIYGKTFEGFETSAEHALHAYSWPGNVHELYAVIQRAALTRPSHGKVSGRDLGLGSKTESVGPTPTLRSVNLDSSVGIRSYTELKKEWSDSFEKEFLVSTLKRHSGNVSAAAREAKLDRSNFLRLLRRHGLKSQDFRSSTETIERMAA